MSTDKRIAVLASGTGSLLKAMVEEKLPIVKMYADRLCPAYSEVAREAKIPATVFLRSFTKDFDRVKYTQLIVKSLQRDRIDVVVMAGWMTIFSSLMFKHFGGRILNIHPSLLPAFKGDHAVRDALQAGAKVTGTTVHIATAELDAGPILARCEIPVQRGDTVETLHERIKQVERVLYPKTVREFLKTL